MPAPRPLRPAVRRLGYSRASPPDGMNQRPWSGQTPAFQPSDRFPTHLPCRRDTGTHVDHGAGSRACRGHGVDRLWGTGQRQSSCRTHHVGAVGQRDGWFLTWSDRRCHSGIARVVGRAEAVHRVRERTRHRRTGPGPGPAPGRHHPADQGRGRTSDRPYRSVDLPVRNPDQPASDCERVAGGSEPASHDRRHRAGRGVVVHLP